MRKAIAIALACFLVTVGCSPTGRDRLKRFFFEIPDEAAAATPPPAAIPAAYQQPTLSLPAPRFVSMHPPFVRRQCSRCHEADNHMRPRENLLDACTTCHPRFFSAEVRHAPVEQGQCTECHDMHRSTNHKLLKMPVFDLCIECHDEPEDLSETAHTVDGVEQCIACHDPHFGGEMLMKPHPTIIVPTDPEDSP